MRSLEISADGKLIPLRTEEELAAVVVAAIPAKKSSVEKLLKRASAGAKGTR